MLDWWKQVDFGPRTVIGHRGYSARYPENTVPAFRAAMDAGADAVELDVRLTADRVPVVIHDETVDRTTDGEGRVDGYDAQALQALDAGAYLDAAFEGTRIPTLDEVLDHIGRRVLVNVELKPDRFDEMPDADDLAFQVGQRIVDRGLDHEVVVSCFDVRHLHRLHRAHRRVRLSYLREEMNILYRVRNVMSELHAVFVSPSIEGLHRDSITGLAPGCSVIPYTANDVETMWWCLDAGARGFFTNEVELARQVAEDF